MELLGWVERQPNPADKRTSLLQLTRQGQQHAEQVLGVKQQIIDEFFQGLDADAASVVYGLLKRLS